MASSAVQDGSKSNGSLECIAKLESSIGWTRFDEEIRNYLRMNGYADLLDRHTTEPAQERLTAAKWEEKKDIWWEKQQRAKGIVVHRLGRNAMKDVEKANTVDDMLEKLKEKYQPSGSAIFQKLDREYQELTLAHCKGVTDFSNKLREARDAIELLDKSCGIKEPHFINKFLRGLGPPWDIWLTSFNIGHPLLPSKNSAGEITRKAVSFEEAVMAAEEEEQSRVNEEVTKTALISMTTSGDRKTIEDSGCTHCGKLYHTAANCFELRPDLKKAFEEKKRKRREKKKEDSAKRQKKGEKNGGDEGASNAPLVATLAYQIPESFDHVSFMATRRTNFMQDVYVADTGCSQHSSCRREDFISYRPYTGTPITGIGGTQVIPQGIGTVKLECNVDGKRVLMLLTDTVFCPDMGVNLISISQLLQKGAQVSFALDKALVTHRNKTFTFSHRGGLFLLDS